MIEVINGYRDRRKNEFGRSVIRIMRGTPLGNPFKMGGESERGYRIEQYRQWLWKQMQSDTPQLRELKRLAVLHKQNEEVLLSCCCKPKPCHGDIVKRAIEWLCK